MWYVLANPKRAQAQRTEKLYDSDRQTFLHATILAMALATERRGAHGGRTAGRGAPKLVLTKAKGQ